MPRRDWPLTDQSVGDELADGGQGEACDWSSRLLRPHDLQERTEELVRWNVVQICASKINNEALGYTTNLKETAREVKG